MNSDSLFLSFKLKLNIAFYILQINLRTIKSTKYDFMKCWAALSSWFCGRSWVRTPTGSYQKPI